MDTTKKLIYSFSQLFLLSFLLSDIGQQQQVLGHRQVYGFRPTKLFVFGDSYVDTGNVRKSVARSWNEPYGITFPGKPAGRFSDGRVFTDYLARFVGIKTPIAYRWKKIGLKQLKYGMNFAYGGTGVFDTLILNPNMTTQIHFFHNVIKKAVYTPADLKSSMAFVSVAGNDYSTYVRLNGSTDQGLQQFITKVVNQLTMNLKRIHGLGVKKIVVPSLPPVGCLPRSTSELSFQNCNAAHNSLAGFHNQLLKPSTLLLSLLTFMPPS